MEPVSHYYYSDRLKLQFWDWGQDGLPPLLLVHGGLDHARNWDWVARSLREHFHVYAMDLRGHGNSAWAPGALYSVAEHVFDVSTLVDTLGAAPISLIGHSLGGILTLVYSGLYPDRVRKVIAIEGLGLPAAHRIHKPAPDRMRAWMESVRQTDKLEARSYPNLEAAVERMKEANPHLSDEVARHLTLHGTNWNADGSLSWKFDNYVRHLPPYGHDMNEQRAIYSEIACPALLVWGHESWLPDPDTDERALAIPNRRVLKVADAGHWVHHDRLELFLEESKRFLLEP
ncbi:MAG TPA: alpha/beta hydrolase [Bryobacteraceae bacterium]|nr:alpha/beta hydrolase [Bryobacteraceae bacterium]